jgi:hypothetical protein
MFHACYGIEEFWAGSKHMEKRELQLNSNDLWLLVFALVSGWLLIFRSGLF